MVEMISPFDDLCRFCASKIDVLMSINIFAPDQRDLLKKVNLSLPVNMSANDNFPKIMCMECAYKLDVTFEFRERSRLTEHLFEEMLNSENVLVLQNQEDSDSGIILTSADFQTCESSKRENKILEQALVDQISYDNIEVQGGAKVKFEQCPLQENGVRLELKSEIVADPNSVIPFDDEAETEDRPPPRVKRKQDKSDLKSCSECGKVFATNSKLIEHMRRHTGEKPFTCSYETCKKAFRSKIGLAQHEAGHSGQFELFCVTCGKGFQCKSYLVVHQRVHSDAKPFNCTHCSRSFKTKQSLQDHVNRHLGVKPFLCDICGRGFITKGLCKSHQKVHSGKDNRQYPCNVCRKMFVSKSYLNTHFRIHSGEKPYMCEVCGKGFVTRVDLRIHSTLHTGEKKFICETCGKAFARRDALRCHKRCHTGERPYKCEYCGQSFTQFSPMATHKRLHTGERPYPCDICSKSFVSRSTLMAHKKKVHETDTNTKPTTEQPAKQNADVVVLTLNETLSYKKEISAI